MANWKDYLWVMPNVGAIITYISMTVPAIISVKLFSDFLGPLPWDMNLWLVGYFELGDIIGWVYEFTDLI
ncbi:MAG: hypothetical protein ACFFG0_36700 [Candidatus Thorarchaeota archaeon]